MYIIFHFTQQLETRTKIIFMNIDFKATDKKRFLFFLSIRDNLHKLDFSLFLFLLMYICTINVPVPAVLSRRKWKISCGTKRSVNRALVRSSHAMWLSLIRMPRSVFFETCSGCCGTRNRKRLSGHARPRIGKKGRFIVTCATTVEASRAIYNIGIVKNEDTGCFCIFWSFPNLSTVVKDH